jgi:excinuclease ABC subunit A
MRSHIEIIKACENNLKDISVNIRRDRLTVITGVSGSGKSSLAYDVLFAEGQRRFLDALSAYDRSRLPQMKRPLVQDIRGLSPIINIEQKRGTSNPRSTIGTITDMGSYLRLLYSVMGEAFCPYCDARIMIKRPEQIADEIVTLPEGTIIEIRAIVFKIYN